MASPDDRKYAETHEWHKLDGDTVTIGITRFAVDELTDITYLEFSKESGEVSQGETFGEIESVKTTSDLYSGVAGEIVEVNQEAVDNPAIINEDPWEKGWLIKVKASDPGQLDSLMSAGDYDARNES